MGKAGERQLRSFRNGTPRSENYTLSLHDALPISVDAQPSAVRAAHVAELRGEDELLAATPDGPAHEQLVDRKSTRLNSSHANISYAVFCLKKKTGGISEKSAAIDGRVQLGRTRQI